MDPKESYEWWANRWGEFNARIGHTRGRVREPQATVFVASPADAAAGASSAITDGRTGARIRGVSVESIAALHFAALRQPYRAESIDLDILASHDRVFVYDEMHGGWLFGFPAEVVAALASLEGKELDVVAAQWQAVFVGRRPPFNREEVTDMLQQVATIARTAEQEQLPMFWLAPSC
jgi:hypothetical protein